MAPDPVRRRRLFRRIMWGLAVSLVVGTLALAVRPKPVGVDVAVVVRERFVVTVNEDGRTRLKDRYVVSSPLSGNLARPDLDPGDTVDVQQIVARIAPLTPPLLDERTRRSAEARVAACVAALRQSGATKERAKSAKEFADRELARQRTLSSEHAVSETALDAAELESRTRREELTSAEFAERVAAHELEVARATLGRLRSGKTSEEQFDLRSPISGVVLKVLQESEGAVQTGTPLLELGDPTALEIVADVLTADAVNIRPGAGVIVEQWGGSATLRGHVRIVEPSAFTKVSALGVEEQRANVVIDLDEPHEKWRALGDGYRVAVRIVVHEAEDVLQIPPSSAFKIADRWYVYRLADSVVRMVPVDLGRRSDSALEVTSGLAAGDRTVLYPSDRLADGAKVEVRGS